MHKEFWNALNIIQALLFWILVVLVVIAVKLLWFWG